MVGRNQNRQTIERRRQLKSNSATDCYQSLSSKVPNYRVEKSHGPQPYNLTQPTQDSPLIRVLAPFRQVRDWTPLPIFQQLPP